MVHFTETCDAPGADQGLAPGKDRGDRSNLITTEATADDTAMTALIHEQLGSRDCCPAST